MPPRLAPARPAATARGSPFPPARDAGLPIPPARPHALAHRAPPPPQRAWACSVRPPWPALEMVPVPEQQL